eukprot:m.150746 g.150746  ORF g.150746 m.150746 type:complete len:85 (-) comp30741_c2_seq4:1371-1625(-)
MDQTVRTFWIPAVRNNILVIETKQPMHQKTQTKIINMQTQNPKQRTKQRTKTRNNQTNDTSKNKNKPSEILKVKERHKRKFTIG